MEQAFKPAAKLPLIVASAAEVAAVAKAEITVLNRKAVALLHPLVLKLNYRLPANSGSVQL